MGLPSLKGSQITSTSAGARGHGDRGQNAARSEAVQHASGLAGSQGRGRGRGGQAAVE
jgi:hypothetical protein